MPLPQVHLAFGMAVGSLAAVVFAFLRRRWLVWAPVLMVGLGLYAVMPDALEHLGALPKLYDLGAGREAPHRHAPGMDFFVLHRWLDEQEWANTPMANRAGFQAVAALFLLTFCAFGFAIARRLPRMPEAREALERLRGSVESVRALAPVVALAPMMLAAGGLGWALRTSPTTARRDQGIEAWAQLVAQRTGVRPGGHLGIVRGVWHRQGQWVWGDLMAFSSLGGGSLPLAELLARARASGCDFLVVADVGALRSPRARRQWLDALAAASARNPKLTTLAGALCGGPEAERLLVIGEPDAPGVELLAEVARRFGNSPLGALRWLGNEPRGRRLVALIVPSEGRSLRSGVVGDWMAAAPQVVGLLALRRADKLSAREARARWAEAALRPGGVWDELLDRGALLWATAAGGFERPDAQFLPGEYAATWLWTRGRAPGDILAALRGGCLWCGEGHGVRSADLAISTGATERRVRSGEVVWVAPGDETVVELGLEVPPHDFAGRKTALERVELVSNFSGRPEVIASFEGVAGRRLLTHIMPPARDANGGTGFYVRARGWGRVEGGARLFFYTGPVRVLVHSGPPPPPRRPSSRVARSPRRRPRTATKATRRRAVQRRRVAESSQELRAMGLPPSVRALAVERFLAAPGPRWRGEHVAAAGERGPALRTDSAPIEMLQSVALGENTRLFFRCFANGPEVLRVVARSSASAVPLVAARRLPQRQWVEFDLSLRKDFLATRAGGSRLVAPARLEALEWRAAPLGEGREFFVTDVALYEPTLASRLERARQRAAALELATRDLRGAGPGAGGRQWFAEVRSRLDGCRGRLASGAPALSLEEVERLEGELDALAREVELLRLHAATARAFGVIDPGCAVLVAPAIARYPARRVETAALPAPEPYCEVSAAANEAESVQLLVVALREPLRSVRVRVSDLRPLGGKGPGLEASEIEAELVGELKVEAQPGLPPERWGQVPDPLLPLEPFDVERGTLRSVLLTVRVPCDLPPGNYQGVVTVAAERVRPLRLGLRLRRWNFALGGRHLRVVAPIDWRALQGHSPGKKPLSVEFRRALYGLLLAHRLAPTPLLTGEPEADLAEVTWCLERGQELVVLAQLDKAAEDPRLERAGALAARLREKGWGRCGAVVLPRLETGRERQRQVGFTNETVRRYPLLAVVSGGEGEPPGELLAAYWRRPLGAELPALPHDFQTLEVRRSRSTRREAWELVGSVPGTPTPDLRLTNSLLEARVLPWLAWGHGVRALFLRGTTGWGSGDLGGRVLVYPRPDGGLAGSLRLVALRDGAEDYEYLRLLWDRVRKLRGRGAKNQEALLVACEQLLADAEQAAGYLWRPCTDWNVLAGARSRLAKQLERLEEAWWAEVDRSDDLAEPVAELEAAPGDGEVVLEWKDERQGAILGYNVYRSCDPARGYARVNRRLVRGQRYRDTAVRNDRRYYYFLRAVARDGSEGRRSEIAHASPAPRPRVVWLPMADLRSNSTGPFRVRVELRGPGTREELPLVIPQIDYAVAQAPYDGFEPMNRANDGTWFYDVADPGWARLAGRSLRLKVRIVDRLGKVVAEPVERAEEIEAPRGPQEGASK